MQPTFNAVKGEGTKRSTFIPKDTYSYLGTCNTGDVITPFVDTEINPGENWKMKFEMIARQTTPLEPTMDLAFMHIAVFFVPHQQIWTNWNAFMGENRNGNWDTPTPVIFPKIVLSTPVKNREQLDYMGVRPGISGANIKISALASRALLHIRNNWLINKNYTPEIAFAKDDSETIYQTGNVAKFGGLIKINRRPDYFTMVLPDPQRGPETMISLIGDAEVKREPNAALWKAFVTGTNTTAAAGPLGINTVGNIYNTSTAAGISLDPVNGLYADLENASGILFNELRTVSVETRIYEQDGRAGMLMPDIVALTWGVMQSDLVMQIPEYIWGICEPLSITQVPQTSSTDATSPQGKLAGYGYTHRDGTGYDIDFTSKYHGTLIVLFWIRTRHTYSDGLKRQFLKFDRNDYWHPMKAGLGEQPTYQYEISWNGTNGIGEDLPIFGYMENGAEYKNFQNMAVADMRPDSKDAVSGNPNSLAFWHFAESYAVANPPMPTTNWFEEKPDLVDRTISAKTASGAQQWKFNIGIDFKITRDMPLYNVPGIDIF
ncbi:MAG: major capsid protein [Microvirus sp.]|nr:MAG: major capsid protein [Microvirus sp.]